MASEPGPTRDTGWTTSRTAKAWAELMRRLGYERYGAQGGDWGAFVSPELGRVDPDHVVSVHVNAATMGFIPFGPVDPGERATFKARLASPHFPRITKAADRLLIRGFFQALGVHLLECLAVALRLRIGQRLLDGLAISA